MIGPAVQGAVAQAKLLFPNGMPPPPEVAAAASQAAQQVPAGRGILDSLMNPEGDHIGFGLTLGGSAAAGAGVQGVAQCMFDVVFDYRRNDIGFFISPGGGICVIPLGDRPSRFPRSPRRGRGGPRTRPPRSRRPRRKPRR